MTISIAAVVTSPSAPSRTITLVEAVLGAARDAGAVTELVNIGGLDIAAADGRKAEEYEGDTARVLSLIDSADAVVFGMPVYRAGIPGSLKNLLDIVPRGRFDGVAQALRAKPVVVAATGASDHHFLALDSLGEMMRGFFGAYVVPPGLYASHGDFTEGVLTSQRVIDCADRSGRALVALASGISASEALQAVEPLV
jgi:FMN reductase